MLLTGYDDVRKAAEVVAWYSGTPAPGPQPGGAAGGIAKPVIPAPKKFIVVDLEGIPLQQTGGGYFMKESELPKSIRGWLEAHSPTTA